MRSMDSSGDRRRSGTPDGRSITSPIDCELLGNGRVDLWRKGGGEGCSLMVS